VFERVVSPKLFISVLREIIAGEERWDLEVVKENLEMIDAVADRAGRALLPQRGNVAEAVFSGGTYKFNRHLSTLRKSTREWHAFRRANKMKRRRRPALPNAGVKPEGRND
jgi:hypothetical protein